MTTGESVPNQIEDPTRSGWGTAEFSSSIGTVVAQLMAFISTLYLISPSQGLTPTEKIAAVGGLFAFITGSTTASAFFTKSRSNIKVEAIKALAHQSTPLTVAPPDPPAPPAPPAPPPYYPPAPGPWQPPPH